MTRVGVVAALQLEARPLRRYPALVVRVCGVSAPCAGDAVQALAEHGSRLIVSWGTAGALSPRLRAGDLVVPEHVIPRNGGRLATDSVAREAFQGEVSGNWPVTSGTLLESDRMLGTSADKRRLGRRRDAVAVDMESGCIGEACAALDLPFLVVRAVVDEIDDRLPPTLGKSMTPDGSLRMVALLAALATHPDDWAVLARLPRRYRRAHRALGMAAGALARCTGQTRERG